MKCGCIILKGFSHLVFVPFTVKNRDSWWHGCEFPTKLCLCNQRFPTNNITYHLYLITKAYNVLVKLVLRMSKQVVHSCQIITWRTQHLCSEKKHYKINVNQEEWSSWSTILCSIWIQFKVDTPTLIDTQTTLTGKINVIVGH